MSQFYEIRINVWAFDPDLEESIKEALNEEWEFDKDAWENAGDWYTPDSLKAIEKFLPWITNSSQGNLCGGIGEEEFSKLLAQAVWKGNGGYCPVEVFCTYLEEIPTDKYSFDQEKYNKIMTLGGENAPSSTQVES